MAKWSCATITAATIAAVVVLGAFGIDIAALAYLNGLPNEIVLELKKYDSVYEICLASAIFPVLMWVFMICAVPFYIAVDEDNPRGPFACMYMCCGCFVTMTATGRSATIIAMLVKCEIIWKVARTFFILNIIAEPAYLIGLALVGMCLAGLAMLCGSDIKHMLKKNKDQNARSESPI